MNQRFEDTLVRALDSIAGMSRDYRVLEERNRLAFKKLQEQDETILKLTRMLNEPADCEDCPHQHPEYREARFALIDGATLSSLPGPFCKWLEGERRAEREDSDIDLAVGMGGQSFTQDAWEKEQGYPFASAPKAPRCYDTYFDVTCWRWVHNTVRIFG